MRLFSAAVLMGVGLGILPVLHAGIVIPTSACAPDFSVCTVYENQPVFFPGFPGGFVGAAGDVVINDGSFTVAVFRIFNDVFDTGGGTGLGDFGFLYSATFNNLPDPTTYSANTVTIPLGGQPTAGSSFDETVFAGGFGTEYDIFTLTPEPAGWALGLAGVALLLWRRRNQEDL